MKKVLFSISTLFGGGAERVVSVWASQLAESGYDVSLLLYGRRENEYKISDKVKICTIADSYEEYKKMSYIQRLKTMRKIVKSIAPDVVINFLQRMQIWMMAATFGMKLKRIETIRISPWNISINSKIEKALWHLCFKRADATIFQNSEQSEYFSKSVREKGVVIPNPISKRCIESPKKDYSERATEFVAAGRLTEQKNYPIMINAFKSVHDKYPNIKLSIYGVGEEAYTQKLQQMIEDSGLNGVVTLAGRSDDMPTVLLNADAFIMTSNFEGMPNALAEAMTIGLPCISTDCRTGPKDLIDDGVNGYLVRVGDSDSIADAIIKIVGMNSEERSKMGASAREKVLGVCSEENSLKKLQKLINE